MEKKKTEQKRESKIVKRKIAGELCEKNRANLGVKTRKIDRIVVEKKEKGKLIGKKKEWKAKSLSKRT